MEIKLLENIGRIKCPYCAYQWIVRKENPVECPNCKRRLKWNKKK